MSVMMDYHGFLDGFQTLLNTTVYCKKKHVVFQVFESFTSLNIPTDLFPTTLIDYLFDLFQLFKVFETMINPWSTHDKSI